MVRVVGVAVDIKNAGLLCQVWVQPKQSQLARGVLPELQMALAMLAAVQLLELWLLPTAVVVAVAVSKMVVALVLLRVQAVRVCLAPV
jgi:hypothetical protein